MALQFGVSFAGGDFEFVRVRRWPFSIGRGQRNDLCLSNSSRISRAHARISKEGDIYQLIVFGRNPTYLNGEKVPADQPRKIQPGDTIEFPDYRLSVRDTAEIRTNTATINVQAVTTTTILVRRIASALNTHRWSVEAIFDWLQEARGREIWIRHQKVELYLHPRLGLEDLSTRIALFDQLITHLDPHQLAIEIADVIASPRTGSG
ncbi:MAG: FHA domain-containing protein [Pseudomonadales bacterium]